MSKIFIKGTLGVSEIFIKGTVGVSEIFIKGIVLKFTEEEYT